jgi:signal transduction histidine kinase
MRFKLALAYAAVPLVAILIAEGVALSVTVLFVGDVGGLYAAAAAMTALVAGLLLGTWVSRPVVQRFERTLEISRVWLHGNLSLRIADPTNDELGLLAGRLDLLAEHLEQDEQDLDRLREVSTRLTDQVRALAVDEERDRLARELHDGVKQHLFSLAMTASAIRAHLEGGQGISPDLAEMVREAETTAQNVQRELTRLIENLRPASLEEQGLAVALNDYTLLFGAREHILIYLDVQGNDALLPPSIAESLYRVAQEALHNVARHARATRVDVALRCLSEQTRLTVRDNGVGFDVQQARRGLGLGSMQDRVMSIGGRLTIDSERGGGTVVRAEVGLTRLLDMQADIAKLDRERRPDPVIDNWAWLGQRLVIPVGQVWPWLPADQIHLRQPLVQVSAGPLFVKPRTGWMGLRRGYLLQTDSRGTPWVRLRHRRSGYDWRSGDASWALHHVRGPGGMRRAVLMRNEQPLAAMQSQGRLLNVWTEIVYDGRGYCLSRVEDRPGDYVLTDQAGEVLCSFGGGGTSEIAVSRPLPLPLLAMAVAHIVDEKLLVVGDVGATEAVS